MTYLHSLSSYEDEHFEVKLVTSKTKVTPIK